MILEIVMMCILERLNTNATATLEQCSHEARTQQHRQLFITLISTLLHIGLISMN